MRCNNCGTPCEVEDRYCYRCGNYLKERIELVSEEVHNNKSIKLFGTIFSFLSIFILLLSGFIYIFSNNFGKMYLNDSLYTRNNIKYSSTLYGYYKTSIEYDTTYKKIKIFNINDGKELIKNHSKEQKKKCQNPNISEIENRIVKNFKITSVDLCELPTNIALDIENVLNTVFNEFPNALGYMTNITLMNPKPTDTFMAAYIPIFEFANSNANINEYFLVTKSMLVLNSNYFLNYELLDNTVKEASRIGYFPKNAYGSSTIAHELGHYISYVALLKKSNIESIIVVNRNSLNDAINLSDTINSGEFSEEIINIAYNNYLNNFQSFGMSESDFCAEISDYATSSVPDETIAEAFHDYFLNGADASPASIEIIKVIKSYLGDV